MASPEIRRLWKLHLVDASLFEIRKRAAALDPGRKETAELETAQAEQDRLDGEAKALTSELSDLEFEQKTSLDKAKKIEKELLSGKIVNPREVENLQREIDNLKKKASALDERMINLFDLIPKAKEVAAEHAPKVAAAKAALSAKRKAALEEKTRLEEAFKKQNAARPEALEEVPAPLVARYEAIRAKHGTGMAEVKKLTTCAGCGNLLPERTLQSAREDKLVTCEQCHRILYYTEGLI